MEVREETKQVSLAGKMAAQQTKKGAFDPRRHTQEKKKGSERRTVSKAWGPALGAMVLFLHTSSGRVVLLGLSSGSNILSQKTAGEGAVGSAAPRAGLACLHENTSNTGKNNINSGGGGQRGFFLHCRW